ncbi:hypothetical protein EUX98_g6759 [Antrodiella citrinella]|uniref:BTB domain-containing protein n=1 Tax=Antrodiella citrinella TaxID=2447956 RepID=A0A4S4MNC4_9APHY|nr:hypothetical protein EUX98_g6759 [Antrodiella citrinella]
MDASLDNNSLPTAPAVKSPRLSAPKQPSTWSASKTMHYIVPRPFPPPSLANVPVEYIVNQLYSLAPHYWSKPETADCTIVVPLSALYPSKIEQVSRSNSNTPEPFPEMCETTRAERRKTAPALRPAPRMVMKLHMDYLSAHSTLLRSLFSGTSPLDLHHPSPSLPRSHSFVDSHLQDAATSRNASQLSLCSDSSTPKSTGPVLLPRLLPSNPNHPVLHLPVPDPSSFRLLIHYMYFGSTSFMEDALDRGTISWEGLARNVEYLGIGSEVKMFLGRWYGQWRRDQEDFIYEDDDEDDEEMDSEDDSYASSDEEDDDELDKQSSASSVHPGDKMDLDDLDSLEDMECGPSSLPRGVRTLRAIPELLDLAAHA